MSEMEVTEGQLLSQDFGVGGPPTAVEVPPPPRTVETVTLEIRTLQHQANGIILNYAIEIGRRLEESPLVERTTVNTAATTEEDGELVSAGILIQLHKEVAGE